METVLTKPRNAINQDPEETAHADRLPRKVFTVREVAAILGISRESVFALLRSGELGSVLIGKRNRRITAAQLDAYLTRLETQPPTEP